MANIFERSMQPRRSGALAVEDVAIETSVPANVLLAIGEMAGARDDDEIEQIARRAAADLAPRLQAGEQIEDIITQIAGDRAPAFLQRARQIGEERYPDQVRALRQAREQEAVARRAEQPGIIGDFGRAVAAGAVEGAGSAVQGAGVLADQPLSLVRDDETYVPGALARWRAAVRP